MGTSIEPRTREELLQDIIELAEFDRRRAFMLGERIDALLANDNSPNTAKNSAAEALSCTRRYVDQLLAVYRAFGWEHWFPDVDWSMYRTCLGTDNPVYWLNRAMASGWSRRDLKIAYAKETGKTIDEARAGVDIALKARGAVHVAPGLITVEVEGDMTDDNFVNGSKYRIDIRR